ncbi:hypothetical protein [Mycolicibacterium vinylchloridicum]|uniref:hypothetical protein n=1 Tax=Mycolicibacterium vinylchloridicum TaxID=2736928 RepID=UPI0015CE6E95|nr:hypothetical protein [Mycolicibacterium vinylchloridicum]
MLDHSAALLGELVVRARPDRAVRRRGHRARHRQSAGDVEVLARLLWVLREVAWRSRRAADRSVVQAQLQRVQAAEEFDATERARLDRGVAEVNDALSGRWRPSRWNS